MFLYFQRHFIGFLLQIRLFCIKDYTILNPAKLKNPTTITPLIVIVVGF